MKIVKYGMLVSGVLLIAGSMFWFSSTLTFLNTALTAEGTVVELVRTRSSNKSTENSSRKKTSYVYKPVVEFRTQENELIEFMSSAGSNPPAYSKGEKVQVFYKESFPEKARINGFFSLWGGISITGFLGFVFLLIGSSFSLYGRHRTKKINQLKQSGIPISTRFQRVEKNKSFSVNGKNPYQIITQWIDPMTSDLHVFKSENLWFDPSDHIKTDDIPVLIERSNPKNYYVDTAFLPKLAD